MKKNRSNMMFVLNKRKKVGGGEMEREKEREGKKMEDREEKDEEVDEEK